MNLQKFNAKKCYTCAGHLVEDEKILLIHHRMLDIWLSPGGHVDENELPHVCAEREFQEETGIKVKAISAENIFKGIESEFLPNPIYMNLHWINKPDQDKYRSASSGKRCEQHYVVAYYVKRVGQEKNHKKDAGVKDMKWFTRKELDMINTSEDIRQELIYVLEHYPKTI